jgi:hypothetical protein
MDGIKLSIATKQRPCLPDFRNIEHINYPKSAAQFVQCFNIVIDWEFQSYYTLDPKVILR